MMQPAHEPGVEPIAAELTGETHAPSPIPVGATSDPARHPRWTRRRAISTAFYAVIGFFIGVLLTFVTMAVVMIFGRMIAAFQPVHIIVGAALAGLVVAHSSFGTCRTHPAAPVGIAWGLGAGALVYLAIMFLWYQGFPPWFFMIQPIILGAAEAYGGHWGGMRGLRVNLGRVRAGIGRTCASCGYDTSATPDGWLCPECGAMDRYERRPGEE